MRNKTFWQQDCTDTHHTHEIVIHDWRETEKQFGYTHALAKEFMDTRSPWWKYDIYKDYE